MAKVDIIIPAYNAGRFLPAALESVEAQIFQDWRILLINDGSTDDTAAVVAPYRERLGERLLYIWQPNAGLPAARNTALRHTSAEYIALLDADDMWLPERLGESVKSLDDNPDAGLSYGFMCRVNADGAVLSIHDELRPEAEGWIARSIYSRRIDLPCPTITFRRSCVEEIGGFDETLRATEDRDLWLRIAMKHQVVRIPRVIAHYRVTPGAMTSDLERMSSAQMQFIAKHRGAPGCDDHAYKQAVSSVFRQRAEGHAARGQTWRAFRDIASAFWLEPGNSLNWRAAAYIAKRSI